MTIPARNNGPITHQSDTVVYSVVDDAGFDTLAKRQVPVDAQASLH